MITLAFIQLCMILFYHILVYVGQCNLIDALQSLKNKIKGVERSDQFSNNIRLLAIPECTFNYKEYQDGLISDDFKIEPDI